MKIYKEIPLTEFKFWAGAKDNVVTLSERDLNKIEQCLEDIYPNGISETQLNDIFWFDIDEIKEWLH